MISSIGTALPPFQLPRDAAAAFHVAALGAQGDEAQHIQAIHRASGIQQRHSVLPDFLQNGRAPYLFPTPDPKVAFPGTKERMEQYRKHVLPLAKQAIQNCLESTTVVPVDLTHLIVVSCTGMYAPGLDIDLVKAMGLSSSVQRTAINFMGCYGAFPGLKLADAICTANPKAKVMVVCAELCSLHFQNQWDEDSLLAMALFADGAAAVLVESNQSQSKGLHFEGFYNDLAPEGADDMAWKIGDFGFEMKLSAYVPNIIEKGIAPLTERLLLNFGLSVADIPHFAIHPGGRRILQTIEQQLGISKEQNHFAYEVLRNCGNMSSPTVLFVLKNLWEQLTSAQDGQRIISFAFGPGLTLESCLLTYHA